MSWIRLSCAVVAAAFGCLSAFGEYAFSEDFSVSDGVDEAYGIDIERNSHYSHGHGKVIDGQYAILLNGNRHYLATPKLGDFTLDFVWNIQTTHAGGPGYGLVVFFRRDRASGRGHILELFRERKDRTLSLVLDGRELVRRESDATDFTADQAFRLELSGRKGRVSACGFDAPFELAEDLGGGYVALDAASDSQQQLYFRSVKLTSPESPAKEVLATYRMSLDKTQGFALPVAYDVTLSRYASGETLLEAELSGTIRSRPLEGRIRTGGTEWSSVVEKLDTPYLRILDASGETFAKCDFWNGEKSLRDAEVAAWAKSVGRNFTEPEPWPKRFSKVFVSFPEEYSVAAGYRHAIANPWRFAEEGAREQVVSKGGEVLYDGTPLVGGAIDVKATSPADKRIVSKIPADIPQREAALKHAREQHYFYESEQVRFDLATTFRDADWASSEISVEPRFTDVYGNALDVPVEVRETGDAALPGGLRRVTREVSLGRNLTCGVYKLHWSVRTGVDEKKAFAVFEVLPDDPNGPCPPLASGLPQFVSMPNEVKVLEQSAFDPWGDLGGVAHYYSVDNRYPAVGNALEVWRLLPLYRRQWWCWNWSRNSDRLDPDSDYVKDLIRHADVYDGSISDAHRKARRDLGVVSCYNNAQLGFLKEFVKERGLADVVPVPTPYTFEAFRKLFGTCWRDWVDWARPRLDAYEKAFSDAVLAENPKVGFGSYGPYTFYVSHGKTAYSLDHEGYSIQRDPRLRANGSFWVFEEYHHSCDYPLFRPAFFVATYDLHYGDVSRRIFPEIYYSGWGRCMDGAVYMAHPMSRTYLADVHQRRIAYQYVYGTPQFKDGEYRFWTDYGFHARNPENGAMEEFIHAWGHVVRNRPKRPLKAPMLVHDLEALRRNGEYLDEECNTCTRSSRDDWHPASDVGNSGEDDLAYAFEQAVVNGYATPVVTRFAEASGITSANAEFVILPPIVEGTPKDVLAAIRALHARGVPLLAFEQVAGLEDLFGVKRVAEREVGFVKGESFSHRLAKARYAADGAEAMLHAAEAAGHPEDIPLVVRHATASGRTVFVNAPPMAIRRASFRTVFHWGQDSLSEPLKAAMREAMAFLAPMPAVRSEHGLVSAAETVNGDIAVIVSDEPPIYKDRTAYPVPFRFAVSAPGIGSAPIEADTDYSVVERSDDRVVIRARMARDTAYFFRFDMKGRKR